MHSQRFECVCPPGLIGDGMTSCDIYSYETRFSVAKEDTPESSFDKAAFQMVLFSRGVEDEELSSSCTLFGACCEAVVMRRRLGFARAPPRSGVFFTAENL